MYAPSANVPELILLNNNIKDQIVKSCIVTRQAIVQLIIQDNKTKECNSLQRDTFLFN